MPAENFIAVFGRPNLDVFDQSVLCNIIGKHLQILLTVRFEADVRGAERVKLLNRKLHRHALLLCRWCGCTEQGFKCFIDRIIDIG